MNGSGQRKDNQMSSPCFSSVMGIHYHVICEQLGGEVGIPLSLALQICQDAKPRMYEL